MVTTLSINSLLHKVAYKKYDKLLITHNIHEDCSYYVSQINLKYNIGLKLKLPR